MGHHNAAFRRSGQFVAAVAAVAVATSPLSVVTPAAAAVAAPSGLSVTPEGASTPVLTWSRVPGATYQVQVDNDSSFNSPELNLSTANFRATPTSALTVGQNHWRVRSVKGSESSSWASSAFTVTPINVPVPVSPADGANLAQPTDPPLLEWLGSSRAISYNIEVDGDSDFVGAKIYSTKSTSLVVPDPLGAGDWFWRVTAVKGAGLVSLPSGAMSFNVLALAQPTLVSPADSVDTKVGDVVVDWLPVAGAKTYDVQISDGPGFDPANTTSATGVQGTRYSPKTTLGNDQFWWRVRAVDLNGQATEWSTTSFGFNRVWEDQPQPVFPTGAVASPPTLDTARQRFQWTAVPKATEYELVVGSNANFSPGTFKVCYVVGTTYAPRSAADCGYVSGSLPTYWKVRPIDRPYPDGLPGQFYSPTQGFTWSGPPAAEPFVDYDVTGLKVSVDASGSGCASSVCEGLPTNPVLSWDPKPGVLHYFVYLGQDDKFTTSVLGSGMPIKTTNTMMTLKVGDTLSSLPDSSAGQAYHWHVRACRTATDCGPDPLSSATALHTKSFRKVSPAVNGLQSSDPAGTEITFAWNDYHATNASTLWVGEASNQSAKGYRIQVDTEPSFQAPLLDNQVVDQTTYTAFDRIYPEGTLYWRVQATDREDNGLTWSATQSTTKTSPPVTLRSPGNGASVPGTAPFRWDPQAFAASYTVEVYKGADVSFSSVNRLFSATVKTPAYAWTQPIPADSNAYVWRVRRTDVAGNPGPWSSPSFFDSRGAAPLLTGPANGAWQPVDGALFSWSDVPGAVSYALRASNAGGNVVSITTPGNAYATTKALTTGTYSWNVTAVDAAGKTLGTSASSEFRVDATAPAVTKIKPKGIKATSTLKIVFSERVKGVTKSTLKLKLKGAKGAKAKVKAKVSLASTGTTATLNPKNNLKSGQTYILTLSPTITDMAGNAISTRKLRLKVK